MNLFNRRPRPEKPKEPAALIESAPALDGSAARYSDFERKLFQDHAGYSHLLDHLHDLQQGSLDRLARIECQILELFDPEPVQEPAEKPLLGLATTAELLDEIRARVEGSGMATYRTVDQS